MGSFSLAFAATAALSLQQVVAGRGPPDADWHWHKGSDSEKPSVSVASTSPFALDVCKFGGAVHNSAVLVGGTNNSASPVAAFTSGQFADTQGQVAWDSVNSQVVRVTVNTSSSFVGARFSSDAADRFYGVWEYPWDDQLDNAGIEFELKGVGNSEGVNWANARAPFFFSNAGYGVYADTLQMGSYNFSMPGTAEFIFNTSSLVYYVILPDRPGDLKSILSAYAELSSTIEMPPDSGYGPTFWSDNFEEDFHGSVSNAQENYYDMINHLYYNQIRATSMFADRPYGTGNYSYGNFDFDPVYYPTPENFIQNLSDWGFDFQVWVANRAFLDTELYNASLANGWLFPGIDGEVFRGPALNLSIPEAYEYFKQHLSYFPSVGVKGYKIDRGEEGEMPVFEQNVQMGLFIQLCYETMVEKWGESNFFDFARSVVDRSRSKTNVWNGDAHSNYTGFAYSVTSGIRSGLMGFSTWSSDTGGYIREEDDPAEDLWARWMWFSTFSPVYEIPIGTNHTPWYPPDTSDLVEVLKESANMHHDLFPYIKSYTYQAHKTGIPVMRAAFLEAPYDEKTFDMTDAYYFGSELFVAPIITAENQRSVYFPEGTKHLEYFNKSFVFEGGSSASVEMDVHYIPAYVRAGAIVPRGDIYQGNNKWTKDWKPELTIELYPSKEVPWSSFVYYNGDTKQEVPITMRTSHYSGQVDVDYGPVGIGGKFVLFAKNGVHNATLHAGGGSASFNEVESLFDD
ncbi:hypothetical protein KC357_g5200 [Hortaea werneckii]|nr:hypothetical protein KC357_g5200 [Hortaea werneckii]